MQTVITFTWTVFHVMFSNGKFRRFGSV